MKYFTIKELSSTNKIINNVPNASVINNLTALVDNVLDAARKLYDKPIKINSGYRSPELNKAVGGVSNSQHILGEAADITTGTKEGNKVLFNLIRDNLKFDQLIDEKDYTWLHVSYKQRNRNQILHL